MPFVVIDASNPTITPDDRIEVLAVYDDRDRFPTAAAVAEHHATEAGADVVTVLTIPHARTFRFARETVEVLRLIDDDNNAVELAGKAGKADPMPEPVADE